MELQCHRRYVFLAAVVTSLVAPAAGPAEQNGDVSGKRGTTVTIVEPSRFDWGDAGVGAAGAFGLTALVGGAVIALRGR